MTDTSSVFDELYASEINVSISSFWDGGWNWKLGDESNGFVSEGVAEDWDSAVYELAEAASGYYEHSGFNAWWWGSGARAKYWPKPDPVSPTPEREP